MTIAQLMLLVDAYSKATGLAEATISTRVLRDGKRLTDLRNGSDIGVRRIEEAQRWFSENWPAGAEWPAAVERPKSEPAVMS